VEVSCSSQLYPIFFNLNVISVILTDTTKLNALRNTTASILGYSVLQIFPSVKLAGGGYDDAVFYYDFVVKENNITKDVLVLIEEKMRSIIKSDITIKLMNMVESNAKSFLLHHNQKNRAYDLDDSDNKSLVEIIHMEDFVDITFGKHLTISSGVQFFKLLEVKKLSDNTIRIIGSAFLNKKKLKDFCKCYANYFKNSHVAVGQQQQIFNEVKEIDLWYYTQKGNAIREKLKKIVLDNLLQHNYLYLSELSLGDDNVSLVDVCYNIFLNNKIDRCFSFITNTNEHSNTTNGLLELKNYLSSQEYVIVRENFALTECISSLQFIIKILNILGFGYDVVIFINKKKNYSACSDLLLETMKDCHTANLIDENTPPAIKFYVKDNLGRKWLLSYISIEPLSYKTKLSYNDVSINQLLVIESSTIVSFERLIALLLEKNNDGTAFFG
jgi:threonyl-tRNA synthetase